MYWKEHEWERAGTTLNLSVQSEKWGRPLKHLVLHYNLVIKKKKKEEKKNSMFCSLKTVVTLLLDPIYG